MTGTLQLEDGTQCTGHSFGYESSTTGEVVFSTGMVGYPESLTDPSYYGQILIFTYPLIGNYGVDPSCFESEHIQVKGVIVSTYNDTPSHHSSKMRLDQWLKQKHIPALEIKDTRLLVIKLREKGVMLGKIIFDKNIDFLDPNIENLVAYVSTKKVIKHNTGGKKTIVLIDCGAKRNIQQSFIQRNVNVIVVPWDYDIFSSNMKFDAIVISNGPGDPKKVTATIKTIQEAMKRKIPLFGICLGNQILALAAGGDTYKLKFGHRSQNQPCLLDESKQCFLTVQNHGFAVGVIPKGFKQWFVNANDETNEGIIHKTLPFMSVQFHPEASPGPMDTEWIFDYFIDRV